MSIIRLAKPDDCECVRDWRSVAMQLCVEEVRSFFSQRAPLLGNPEGVAQIESDYLSFQPARLLAAFRALPEEAPMGDVLALQRSLQPVALKPQKISWHWQRKKGGRRAICKLPPDLKAAHYLILDLLQNVSALPDFICNAPGRGVQAGVERAKRALEEGYQYCFIGDVRNCFPSIRTEQLGNLLPLSGDLVENNLDVGRLRFRRANRGHVSRGSTGGANPSGPRGLLQGSPASNMVLAILLQGMAACVDHHDVVLCLYSDNLFLAAKSQAELEAAMALIEAYLGDHPAGPLNLHEMRVHNPHECFRFLGFDINLSEDGDIVAVPTEEAFDKIVGRLYDATKIDTVRGDGIPKELRIAHVAAVSGNRAATHDFHTQLGIYAESMIEDIYDAYVMRIATRGKCKPNLGDATE